jgi:hypothetical protein
MKKSLHPLSCVGIGVVLPMFILMTGTLPALEWWFLGSTLRYAISAMMIIGILLYGVGVMIRRG